MPSGQSCRACQVFPERCKLPYRVGNVLLSMLVAQAAKDSGGDWWSDHATLIVGVVGIIVSGLLGPSVTASLAARREEAKDRRSVIVAKREDLRDLFDEAAAHLAGAVSALRPALEAELQGKPPPPEAEDFLRSIFPLGERLRLRLPAENKAVASYDRVREQLVEVAGATGSQAEFEAAVEKFEARRAEFLAAAREVLDAPISDEDPK
jgi:hypothetical protein